MRSAVSGSTGCFSGYVGSWPRKMVLSVMLCPRVAKAGGLSGQHSPQHQNGACSCGCQLVCTQSLLCLSANDLNLPRSHCTSADNSTCTACMNLPAVSAVVPPGYFLPTGSSSMVKCDTGAFRDGWLMFSDPRAVSCTPCGTGIASEARELDANPLATPGSYVRATSASCCECCGGKSGEDMHAHTACVSLPQCTILQMPCSVCRCWCLLALLNIGSCGTTVVLFSNRWQQQGAG